VGGVLLFNTLVCGEPQNSRLKFGVKTRNISLSYCAKCIGYLEPIGVPHECERQTDRQTENGL